MLNSEIKNEFPIFKTHPNLVYLDSAATSQKPGIVIDSITGFYKSHNSNIDRGVYSLGYKASELYESARIICQQFLGATKAEEIIFVRGTTEGLNLIASTFGASVVTEEGRILLSTAEHHSNIVPWVELAEKKKAAIEVLPLLPDGTVDIAILQTLLEVAHKNPNSKPIDLISLTHTSNVLGSNNPIKEICAIAKKYAVPVVVDGAQAVCHQEVDVVDLDCDFYVFSGHKIFAPTGIGVVFGKAKHLNALPPYQGGGGMIASVSFDKIEFRDPPHRFEAGTPNICGAIALGVAIQFIKSIGLKEIHTHKSALFDRCYGRLEEELPFSILQPKNPNFRNLDETKNAGIIAFYHNNVHAHDIGSILDSSNIAVRVGNHCCQPLHESLGISSTVRASFSVYNSHDDVDKLIKGLAEVTKIFL